MICGSVSKPMFSDRKVHTCTRDKGHIGPHQTMPLESFGHLRITEWTDTEGGSQWAAEDPRHPDWKIKDCANCGLRFIPESNRLTKGGMTCFHCVFWTGRLAQYMNGELMVIEGTVYTWGPEHGYGGREFTIATEDGVTTQRGLWCGGDIPPEYRALMPDNATFGSQP
jgi:hypothetical protein